MSLALRPLAALLLISLSSAGLAAKSKVAVVKGPAAPAACVDFYSHVNHSWILAHPLGIGSHSFSRWDELNATAGRQTRDLLDATQPASAGAAAQLLANLVASASDPAIVESAASASAKPLLAQVDSIRKPRDIIKVVMALHAAGVPLLFRFDALRDPQSGQAQATLYPAALGLVDPRYYTAPPPEVQQATALYRQHITQSLAYAGVSDAALAEQTRLALGLETALAQAMGVAAIEAMSPAAAGKAYPALNLPTFLQAEGVAPAQLVVQQPRFFQALSQLLDKSSVPQWQAYLRAQVVHSLASMRARDSRQSYLSALSGVVAPALTGHERMAALTGDEAGWLLDAAYVEKHSSPQDRQRALAIAESIRASMGRALDRATWLSVEGKAASHTKLAAMGLVIAQPPEIPSLSSLTLGRTSYAANVLALRRWNHARSLGRLNSVVWPLPVSQARPVIGYQPGENRLLVTAAALQPPALEIGSPGRELGGFGTLVAQQISLAFADYADNDGQGLAYRQAGLVPQFSAFPAAPAVPVNALRTQRQNAADLAAVELAWDAFSTQGPPPDLASSQEFFRSWAGVWARQDSPGSVAAAQPQAVFAPAKWRVNGPLSNTPGFASTYQCKAGQPMARAPADLLSIWR